MCLVRTVSTGSMATAGTRLAGLARVTKNNRDIGAVRLIDEHILKLSEGPIAHHSVEPLGGMCPVTDTVEVFHDDDTARDTGHNVHDLAADFVVDVFLPISLFALAGCDLVQSAFAPHALAVCLETTPPILGGLARPELDDARPNQSCRFRNPQVYAEELSTVTDGRRRGGTANGQFGVPFAIAFKDLGVTLSQGEGIHVALGDTEREPEVVTTFAERETQCPTVAIANELVGINTKADRQVAVNGRPGDFLEVFRLAHPPVAAGHADYLVDGHASIVGRQAQVTHLTVAGMVDFDHAGGVVLLGKVEADLDGGGEEVSIGFQKHALALGGL